MAGNIKKIGANYLVTLEYGIDEKGIRKQQHKTVPSRKEANAILSEFEADLNLGLYPESFSIIAPKK
ncbi:hypothetical protein EHS13_02125 [Paenibacillus psychroresistens]|uniref:Site-specific integrase n=1 Tax=Paenibacillus psychroresistens TaxID=1778678 RepID=A0A6B8RDH2_9BACL|nr:hypothetical protein [Paenibacillus psychroresistens]QGQ93784.1 hypothetical protein EHS13_02125 [Paenibacillus psychroresistens]